MEMQIQTQENKGTRYGCSFSQLFVVESAGLTENTGLKVSAEVPDAILPAVILRRRSGCHFHKAVVAPELKSSSLLSPLHPLERQPDGI